jgi:hypothetical protein
LLLDLELSLHLKLNQGKTAPVNREEKHQASDAIFVA